MTNPQRVLLAIVLVVAVLGGAWLALTLTGGVGASPSASFEAVLSPGPGSAVPSEPSGSPLPTEVAASPSASPSPSEAPTATPKPTTPPGPPATIAFTELKLDAKDDPDGQDRRITFESQGAGPITATVKALAPMGTAVMCLSADGKKLGCKTTADGQLTAQTTTKHAKFLLTLRGEAIMTPMVEVTLTFPATKPSVTIENARFDGTDYPDTNGLQAIVTPRADGDLELSADWGGHPFFYEIDLIEQAGPGTHTLANQGPATRVTTRLPITAPNPWKLVLQNTEGGFGITGLQATIAWP